MLQPSAEPIVRGSGDRPRAAHAASQERARRSLVERVREKIASLGCDRVWARGAGSQVLLGLRGEDAYARLTPVRDSLFGLAFRAEHPEHSEHAEQAEQGKRDEGAGSGPASSWHPLLLVDALEDVVEYALIAVDAVRVQG